MQRTILSSAAAIALGFISHTVHAQSIPPFPVDLYVDSSYEGLADQFQNPLASGWFGIGYLNPGVTRADIEDFFSVGDLASINASFTTVASFIWPDSNTFGTGLVFDSIVLVDAASPTYAADLAAYKSASGPAGKTVFGWVRDSASIATTTTMAFIDMINVFPLASDTILYSDWAETVATASDAITASNVWIGSLAPVIVGGGVDINDGSPIDGKGLWDGYYTLQTAAVVPEPSTALMLLAGVGALVARRRRA